MFDGDSDHGDCMKNQWLAMERYRLQCAEAWPDSPHKRATVAAIRSAMESLSGEARPSARILEFPGRPDRTSSQAELAA